MSESNLQYDPAEIAGRVLAHDMWQEMTAFSKRQQLFDYGAMVCFGIGLPLLFFGRMSDWGLFCGIGGLIAGAIIFGCKYSFRRKFFREQVVPLLVKAILPSLKYAPYQGLSRSRFSKLRLFGSFDRYHSEDQLKGVIGQTAIEASEVHIEKRHRNGKDKSESYTTIFRGVVFIADFNKHFKCRTVVLPDTAEKLFGKLLGNFLQQMNFSEDGKLVKLENVEFEKKFAVYSTDQHEARYILTPLFMERLLAVQSQEKSPIRVLFEDSNMTIALSRSGGWLEPPFWRSFDRMEILEKTVQEIVNIIKLVEALDLNTRIWTK